MINATKAISMNLALKPFNFGGVMDAIDGIQRRLERFTSALENAGVPYAIVGGNAVAHWVSRIQPAAVRFTKAVDVLLRKEDLVAAGEAVKSAGFIYRHAATIDFFLDGSDSSFEEAFHVVRANEKVRKEYLLPAPDVTLSVSTGAYKVLDLDGLIQMKLTSFRKRDQVHVEDMIQIGLIDTSWIERVAPELKSRLTQIFDEMEPEFRP